MNNKPSPNDPTHRDASYHDGLSELNTPPPDMAQLPVTRGPDPIGQDVRAVLWFIIGLFALIGAFAWKVLS